MIHLLQAHPFWSAVVGYWIFSAAVNALDPPTDKSSEGYKWVYKFLNRLSGNIFNTFGDKIPGLKTP